MPRSDAAARPDGFYLMLEDISEQKRASEEILALNVRLETRVQERTAQLQALNEELEAFAYSVSHDLRAPLRSIRGFSDVLLERYGETLDVQGKEFLLRVCQSSMHMDKLIEDLLEFSRLSRLRLHPKPVNLSVMAGEIAATLVKNEPGREVNFRIADGLEVQGDERLLRVALDNLLNNAWKFTGRKPKAEIEIGRLDTPEAPFYIRDNGAGFDMKFASRLFGVFQRLHSSSDFPGTGVGLATVQRIINRHGGRLWAEAAPDRGATFYFTLPHNELAAAEKPMPEPEDI